MFCTSTPVCLAPKNTNIQPGDEILSIDEHDVKQLSLHAVGNLLQGPDGSEVTLKVRPLSLVAHLDWPCMLPPIAGLFFQHLMNMYIVGAARALQCALAAFRTVEAADYFTDQRRPPELRSLSILLRQNRLS
jgi:hypothetical protein